MKRMRVPVLSLRSMHELSTLVYGNSDVMSNILRYLSEDELRGMTYVSECSQGKSSSIVWTVRVNLSR